MAIFSHTKTIAHAFLEQIMRELESNEYLKKIYSDVLWNNPSKQSPKWAKDGIIVKRPSNPKEGTIEAHGLVDASPVSRHYGLIVYDDIVTEKSVTGPDAIAKTTRAWELSDNLAKASGVRKWMAGTHYCLPAETKILMSDWSHKAISDIKVGDEVVGWELVHGVLNGRGYGTRWLRKSKVLNVGVHKSQPIVRYGFENGRSVTCTPDHKWWRGAHGSGNEYNSLAIPGKWCRPEGIKSRKGLGYIRQLLEPLDKPNDRDCGWLAGFFDGEGGVRKNVNHPSAVICLTQAMGNPEVIDEVRKILPRLGFKYSEHWVVAANRPVKDRMKQDRCAFTINGGWRERYRFLVQIAPTRSKKLAESLYAALSTEKIKLISVEDAGTADVYWIETEAGNYVADGFCSKNSFGDTYKIILERGITQPRIYPATDDGTLTGDPVFLPLERWEEIKKTQRSTVSAQMLLNPVAGNEAVFRAEWLKTFEIRPRDMNVYIMCDPSKGKRKTRTGAASDRTAIAAIGLDPAGNKYLIDGYCHRMSLSERYEKIRYLRRKWMAHKGVQMVDVGYEVYGMQVDTEVIQEWQQRDNDYFELKELNFPREGRHSKADRVERMEPDIRGGTFYLPAVVWHPEDGNKNGFALWRSWTEEDQEEAKKKNERGHSIGHIVYRPMRGLTNMQRTVDEHRIVVPVKRLDEDRKVYDLTRIFIEEAVFFPFAPHDDLLDAASRIYDMEPKAPVRNDPKLLEGWEEDETGTVIPPELAESNTEDQYYDA